jgi:release factor glutamine methyltransferase
VSTAGISLDAGRARGLIAEGARALARAGLPGPRRDAEWLLAGVLGVERLALYTDPPALGDGDARRFADALARRVVHEPLQYILGWEEFRGHRFRVSPAVLVPRPETELLVEGVIELLPAGARLADVGTGSGVIACAIAMARPDVRVVAIDVSVEALAVAAGNVACLGLDDRVALVAGDLSAPLGGRQAALDLVVANLPYIPASVLPALPVEVRGWEPRLALDGGPDGTRVTRRLIADAPRVLRPGGALVMEIGEGQAVPLAAAMRAAGFCDIATRSDLSGVERYIAGFLVPEERRALLAAAETGPGAATGSEARWGGLGEERRALPPSLK